MGVTGIGTVQTYRYNFKTGKISAKDGSENEFISFFNEGHSGGSSKTLNGFDWQVRGGIRFLRLHFGDTGRYPRNCRRRGNGYGRSETDSQRSVAQSS